MRSERAWYTADGDFGAGTLGGGASPVYNAGPTGGGGKPPPTTCAGNIITAVSTVGVLAQNIINSAAKYSAPIFNAATVALGAANAGLLGTDTILAFLTALLVGLGPGELIALLLAVGLALGAILVIIECL